MILRYSPEMPRFPSDFVVPADRVLDIFDFLHYAFGFQVKYRNFLSVECALD